MRLKALILHNGSICYKYLFQFRINVTVACGNPVVQLIFVIYIYIIRFVYVKSSICMFRVAVSQRR